MPLAQFGRKITVIVGSGGIVAAVIFLTGALIYKDWLSPDDGRWFAGAILAAYRAYGLGFVLMVLGLFGLFVVHERLWLFIVSEKNKEIQRVVEQRNRLEEIILKDRGSSDGAPRSGRQRK